MSRAVLTLAQRQRRTKVILVTGATLVSLWVALPIYFLMANALSTPEAVNTFPKQWIPQVDMGSIQYLLAYDGVLKSLLNSLAVAVMTMVGSIALGAPAGYALARYEFKGKSAFRMLIMLTRAFPLPLLALPLTVYFIRMDIDDSLIGLALVHTMLALPFSVLITYSLFSGIPVELEEAAWVFGCNKLQAFNRVVLPLALPGMVASAVFAFIISWNEVFAASVLTVQNRTLTALLLQSLDYAPLHLKFAGGALLVLPAAVFMFLIRKHMFAMWGISNR